MKRTSLLPLLLAFAAACRTAPLPKPIVESKPVAPAFERYCGRFGPPLKTRDFGETFYLEHPGYGLEYVAAWKSALWAAHFVTKTQLEKSFEGKYHRPKWKEEKLLPPEVRAHDDDYPEGGVPYNRGHLAPNADFGSKEGRDDTFVLSNAVPQYYSNNQKIWEWLEGKVRDWIETRGRAFILTGGYQDPDLDHETMGAGEVAVPTHMFKVVLAPREDGGWESLAVVLENREYSADPGGGYAQTIQENLRSVDWIEAHTGLNFFSKLAETSTEAIALESSAAKSLW